ncbi:DUF5372 family protein [Paraburkholderia mimosarum]|uniref:DUF5372 family protein n=1 Tax=Paraburkholderia mimosarum TaxID=312026 RepID=UPI0039089863
MIPIARGRRSAPRSIRTGAPSGPCPGYAGSRSRRCPSHRPSTARDPISDTQLVRVTHPFHPLRGQEFVLLERRCAWGEERVYFRDVSGRLRRLPASWTSVSAPEPFEVLSAGRSTFRVEDLLHLIGLIARHREISATACTKSVKRKSSRK